MGSPLFPHVRPGTPQKNRRAHNRSQTNSTPKNFIDKPLDFLDGLAQSGGFKTEVFGKFFRLLDGETSPATEGFSSDLFGIHTKAQDFLFLFSETLKTLLSLCAGLTQGHYFRSVGG